ncbi:MULTISPECIES: LysR family transcriptional regulator [Streptomycetaceae]|uniref:HTH-type transcriptional regulator araB n=1 Tax=Streptantibioticus cattleyicolor (strain ATCC 35852 / DSM 46488 / JCM 4925 / NBRC 14057 / NRRL 8057) TaxID=1003195 RepID=F8JTH9_STREN|nr:MULTISPECIES: LysR family transcriptional regulator [Streptomycetaceae]AEW95538.1 HTH-type transcriptional regulator araB [Streptantibioticus cattleyicolor NRRL 8057 = DSM 46488]MYS60091.1 LysR family transcriptional regulator [Streptomyces sp. SID5468]CCB75877.1 HTH-type transcriptional regulator araB [Streptantibioticus cattleyicolor NRRL 8057 = DSM 46488]
MDLALLRTFLAVHRAGSFTRAAQLLGLSQPAVTGQIRNLERQLGRQLFQRLPRGVTATTVADELAHKVAPHLDALHRITENELDGASPERTLHLAGPPEFLTTRIVPALAPLTGPGLALRVALGGGDEALAGLADGRHDLAVATIRPRARLLHATPLWDEEQVLVAAPSWAGRIGSPRGEPGELDGIPVVGHEEELPMLVGYWTEVFGSAPSAVATVIVPDQRGVLECVRAGAGMAVLPRYLCHDALAAGEITTLVEPALPPLRTYYLVVRAGTLALPHLYRAHRQLLDAAATW